MLPNFENCDFSDTDLNEKGVEESKIELDFTDQYHE